MSALSSQLSAAGFPGPFPTGDGLSTCIPLSACGGGCWGGLRSLFWRGSSPVSRDKHWCIDIGDKGGGLGELFNIVHIAAKFNRSHGIGGFFSADKEKSICVQMFEGPFEITEELWKNIQKDRRHKIREGFMLSHPETVLQKWGMPLQEPAVLLKNLQGLNN